MSEAGIYLFLGAKIMAFMGWPYQIEGVSIDTPKDKCCQEGAQVLACPVEWNLEIKLLIFK
jgi:hypothetical protein